MNFSYQLTSLFCTCWYSLYATFALENFDKTSGVKNDLIYFLYVARDTRNPDSPETKVFVLIYSEKSVTIQSLKIRNVN